ncbi:MAG: glycosyltransferase family 4 protein [Candidatus Krumholzibacteriia bacterium]
MHILYHHRTAGQDAQGIHIREILHAFRELGHTTDLVSFADRHHEGAEAAPGATATSGPAPVVGCERYAWLARVRALPLVYECAELAYNLWGFWALWRAIRRRRPQLIYERYALFNVSGILASRLWKIPLVLEVNAPLAYEKEHYEKLALRRLAYGMERWICSHSTRTIVVSTPMREILVSEGVPREHLVIVSNGVNPEEIASALGRADVRARLGLGDKLVLGFVGWFKRWHRLDSVVELLASRPQWRQRMHLLLVGDGPEAEPLRRLARELGVEHSITITGPVGRDLIYDHIHAFDVALQPHVTEYASPMKVFEYLALGKCVVAPDLDNIREILTHGEDALLFRPGDAADMARAIEILACDPQRVQQMGERARRTIRERRYYWLDNARRALSVVGLEDKDSLQEPARETVG